MARKTLFVALGVSLILGAVPAFADSQDALEPELDGDNIIHYPEPYELSEVTYVIIQGSAREDGCEFSFSEPLSDVHMMEYETQYDPETCRSVFKRGTPTSEDEARFATRFPRGEVSMQPVSTCPISPGSTSYSLQEIRERCQPSTEISMLTGSGYENKSAYSWGWVDEPLRWGADELFCGILTCPVGDCDDVEDTCLLPPVNYQRNYIHWTPNGNCAITPGTTGYTAQEPYYLYETGWRINSHYYDHSDGDPTCDSPVWSNTTITFKNKTFCEDVIMAALCEFGGICFLPDPYPTFALYNPEGIVGYENGGSNYSNNMAKWGGCSDFLQLGHRWGPGTGIGGA